MYTSKLHMAIGNGTFWCQDQVIQSQLLMGAIMYQYLNSILQFFFQIFSNCSVFLYLQSFIYVCFVCLTLEF